MRFFLLFMMVGALLLAPASADVVETRSGQRFEGTARFADGFVFVRSKSTPAKLKLDEVRSITRDAGTAEEAPEAKPTGLIVEYFADRDWNAPSAVAVAPGPSMSWGELAPNPTTPADFSARLSGTLVPAETGDYTFILAADDFARAQIAGKKFGGDWGKPELPLHLEAGKPVPVLIEFRDDGSRAHLSLKWRRPDGQTESVPEALFPLPDDLNARLEKLSQAQLAAGVTGLLGEYFEDAKFEKRRLVKLSPNIDHSWGTFGELAPGFAKHEFWARWTGKLRPHKTKKTKLALSSHQKTPVRLWLDDKLLLNTFDGPKKKEAWVELKAGQLYDLKIEYEAGKGQRTARLVWDMDAARADIIPPSAFVAPETMPRIQIITPTDGMEIDAADGLPVSVVAVPGKGSVRTVRIVDVDGKKTLHEWTKPPYRAVLPPGVVRERSILAEIVNSEGAIAQTPTIDFAVTSAPSEELNGEWSLARAGGAASPEVKHEGNRIEITGKAGMIGSKSKMPLVCQLLRGDGEIVARLAELKSEDAAAVSLAGITIRRNPSIDARHLALIGSHAGGWIIGAGRGGNDSLYQEHALSVPTWMRIVRTGSTAAAYFSNDGENWTIVGSFNIGASDMLIGLTAFSLSGSEPVTAVFDAVTVRHGGKAQLATGAGVQLTSGTIVQGALKIDGSRVSVRPADGPAREFTLQQVARIFYGAVDAETAAAIPPGWRGAIVNNDLLEGEVSAIAADSAIVNSLIFGLRPVKAGGGLDAVIINDITPRRGAALIEHATGRIVAAELRLDTDALIARDPDLGEIRLGIGDIVSLQRP